MSSEDDVVLAAAAFVILAKSVWRPKRYWVKPSLQARSVYSGSDLLNDVRGLFVKYKPVTLEMTPTLYCLDYSQPALSVDLVIHALGLKVDYKNINLFEKQHFSPEFLKLNPLHTVPVFIDDDGFVLWESRAIMTYLVSKYGKDDVLYPKDLKKRAIVDQRLHFSNDVFFVIKQTLKPLLYNNVKPVPVEQITKVREVQENLEKLLSGHDFMAGDTLTVADYSFITMVDALELLSPDTENQFPQTKSWIQRCRTSMKDFDKVNTVGAKKLAGLIKEKLTS